jgi:hypothetical protein
VNMCQDHWDRLREKINERVLTGLIASDGATAAAQIADQVQQGEATPTNFDPLMGAFWAVGSNVMGTLGRSALYLLGGPDVPEDPIDFAQYPNGAVVRGRLALLGIALTWPRNCGLCQGASSGRRVRGCARRRVRRAQDDDLLLAPSDRYAEVRAARRSVLGSRRSSWS